MRNFLLITFIACLVGCQAPPPVYMNLPPPARPLPPHVIQAVRGLKPKAVKLNLAIPANPYSVTVAWDYDFVNNPTVVGFKVYQGTTSGVYSTNYNAGTNLTYTVPGLALGTTYYFSATAYDTNGLESNYATEISMNQPPVNVVTISDQIYYTTDLAQPWQLLANPIVYQVNNPTGVVYLFRSVLTIAQTNGVPAPQLNLKGSTMVMPKK